MMGRSHGIHAEPITFGLKVAVWYDEFGRHERRLAEAMETIAVGKLSGAVGTFAHIEPEMEREVCEKFGLKPAPVSTQIVQRDRHAHFFSVLAGIAASIEKVAVEIRHLQRTEVGEAAEPFGKGQKGSSAMPHKRNPILCENLTGLARIVRTNAMAALENVALWHERDISHSSVERVIAPDSTILVDFMLARLAKVIDGLDVSPERMKQNLQMSHGLYNSQDVMLALARAGMKREDAYRLVQARAMESWKEGKDFFELLANDSEISAKLSRDELAKLFDIGQHTKHVDTIFDRVFNDE
jgi:adenylosuccinate lyase